MRLHGNMHPVSMADHTAGTGYQASERNDRIRTLTRGMANPNDRDAVHLWRRCPTSRHRRWYDRVCSEACAQRSHRAPLISWKLHGHGVCHGVSSLDMPALHDVINRYWQEQQGLVDDELTSHDRKSRCVCSEAVGMSGFVWGGGAPCGDILRGSITLGNIAPHQLAQSCKRGRRRVCGADLGQCI